MWESYVKLQVNSNQYCFPVYLIVFDYQYILEISSLGSIDISKCYNSPTLQKRKVEIKEVHFEFSLAYSACSPVALSNVKDACHCLTKTI